MKDRKSGPDPVVDSDRDRGTTEPEELPEGSNVVGRPGGGEADGKQPLSQPAALKKGGSFDGVAPGQELGEGAKKPSRK
jgi:hypothetical protein